MALAKRIIPCLDVKNGKTVKGINFVELRDMGDPVELARYYNEQRADELVFLDITATNEQRKTLTALVADVARAISIPFTIGGGISNVNDVYNLLKAGADKIAINSAAIKDPSILHLLEQEFGSQCIVVAIDAKADGNDWMVYINGGRIPTGIKATDWAKQAADMGAGEILLTSIDCDGTRNGYDLALTRTISNSVSIPVIASGGAGNADHFATVFKEAAADAALAAGIFHTKEVMIPDLKKLLIAKGISIRS